jgi:hypothetical protein
VSIRRRDLCPPVVTTLVAALAAPAALGAQTLVESSLEARFQLDFAVPAAALQRMIPAGFTVNVSMQGPATDCNLRVIFIERLTINDAEGRPVGDGSNNLVYLTVPVTDPSGQAAQLVIGGITQDPTDAPGPFGVYKAATTSTLHRMTMTGPSGVTETQEWSFRAATGEHLEMRIVFERGVANRGQPRETRFYSAASPGTSEISRQQQVLDILKNVTTNPRDRVRSFSFSGGGGAYAPLFDGTERVLSWDNIVWLDRDVLRS